MIGELQHVVTTNPTGRVDLSEFVDGFELVTRNPGGFWTARVGLRVPEWRAQQLWRGWAGGSYEVVGLGGTVLAGTLSGMQRGGGQSSLLAQGAAVMALRDSEAWTVYADSSYGAWEAEDSDQFDADNNNRVFVTTRSGVEYVAADECGVTYPESGVTLGRDIIRVEATVEVVITTGTWSARLLNASGMVIAAYSATTSTTISATITATAGLRWVLLKTGSTEEGEASARLTDVVVRTLYPTNSEDIFADVLSTAGVTTRTVSSSGLTLDQAMYQGQDRLWEVVEDVVALGNGGERWVAVAYEHGADFRAWASVPTWLVTPDVLAGAGVQRDREDVLNAVRPRLPDGWMGAWQTDASSIAKYGRRERTLDLQMMSQAQATVLAGVFLAERAEPVSGVSLDAGLQVRRFDGALWPSFFIRAGDVVRLRDVVEPDGDVDIRVAETAFDGRVVRVVPVGAENRLEVMLAGLGR